MRSFFLSLLFSVFLFSLSGTSVFASRIEILSTPTLVTNTSPTSSVAYFGLLEGTSITFALKGEDAFILETSIFVPDVDGATRDFSVLIQDGARHKIASFSGKGEGNLWQHWFEAWTGEWYWRGADFKAGLPRDTYFLTVSNPKNTGKFVLVVGGNSPAPSSFSELFSIEMFFGNPSALIQSRTGGLTLLFLLLIAGFVWLYRGR